MVETVLAVAILAIGATAAVSLLPAGIKQSKDAITQNYSANFADDTCAWVSKIASSDWFEASSLPYYADLFTDTGYPRYLITSEENPKLISIEGTDLKNLLDDNNQAIQGVFLMRKNTASNGMGVITQVFMWMNSNGTQIEKDFKTTEVISNTTTTSLTKYNNRISSLSSSEESEESKITVPVYEVTATNNSITDNFELTTTDGGSFNKDTMKLNSNSNYYNSPQTFLTTELKLTSSQSNSIVVDDSSINLQGKDVTLSSPVADPMKIQVWKDENQQWHYAIDGGSTSVHSNDNSNLSLPKTNRQLAATQDGKITNDTTDDSNPDASQKGIGVNIEISWPLEQKDYAKRNKVRYYLEIYNMKKIGTGSTIST